MESGGWPSATVRRSWEGEGRGDWVRVTAALGTQGLSRGAAIPQHQLAIAS